MAFCFFLFFYNYNALMLIFWWIWIRDIRSKWILIISWKRNINFECDKVLCVILWKIVYKCVFLFVCCMCVKLDCGPTKLTRCPFAHLSMDEFFFSSVFGVFLFVCISTVNKLLKGEKKKFKSAGQILNRDFFYTENWNRFSVAAMNWLLDILASCVAAVIFFTMHVFVGFCLIFFSKFLQF